MRRLLFLILFLVCISGSVASGQILSVGSTTSSLSNGLVAWWKFDEGNTGTLTYDSIGGNNGTWSGTQIGGIGYYASPALGSYAGRFDGSADVVTIPDNAALRPSHISVSAWFRLQVTTGAAPAVISKPHSATWASPYVAYSIRVPYFSSAMHIECMVGNGTTSTSSADIAYAVAAGVWYQVGFSYDGANLKTYVNGVQIGTTNTSVSGNIDSATQPVTIGSDGSGSDYFNGSIDDVRIYNRVLSANEFLNLYNSRQWGLVNLPANGLQLLPSMGWSSWQAYALTTTEAEMKANALAMTTDGLQAAGYQYVETDGNAATGRDANSNLTYSTSLYPDGMAAIGTYIHGLGLKYGFYAAPSPGNTGCASYPGSMGFELKDALQWASFGIDYLKLDNCYTFSSNNAAQYEYQTIGQALRATGQPIVFMVSPDQTLNFGTATEGFGSYAWAGMVGGNEFWSAEDLSTTTTCSNTKLGATWTQFTTMLDQQYGFNVYSYPGRYNLPQYLPVGNGCVTDTEGQSSISLLAVLAAPLWASIPLAGASTTTLATLTNSDVIAVDQDALGLQGTRVSQVSCGTNGDNCEVYARQLSSGAWAVVLFNRDSASQSIAASWSMFGQTGPFTGWDCWAHSSLGVLPTGYTTTVASHGTAMLTLTP